MGSGNAEVGSWRWEVGMRKSEKREGGKERRWEGEKVGRWEAERIGHGA